MDRIKGLDSQNRIDLANSYKAKIDMLDLHNNVKNISELSFEFYKLGTDMNSRKWRSICEDIMYLYIYGNLDFIVVGSGNGYTATNDIHLIEQHLEKKYNQAMGLMRNASKLKKCLETRFNRSFDFGDVDEACI
jgi:hypothetical protein